MASGSVIPPMDIRDTISRILLGMAFGFVMGIVMYQAVGVDAGILNTVDVYAGDCTPAGGCVCSTSEEHCTCMSQTGNPLTGACAPVVCADTEIKCYVGDVLKDCCISGQQICSFGTCIDCASSQQCGTLCCQAGQTCNAGPTGSGPWECVPDSPNPPPPPALCCDLLTNSCRSL